MVKSKSDFIEELRKTLFDRLTFQYFSGASKEGLKDIVRRKLNEDPITADNVELVPGVLFYDEGFSEIMSEEILNVVGQFGITWDSDKTYAQNDVAYYGDSLWQSTSNNNTGNTPSETSEDWRAVNLSSAFEQWSSSKTYSDGDFVLYLGQLYRSLQDSNQGNVPNEESSIYWTESNLGDTFANYYTKSESDTRYLNADDNLSDLVDAAVARTNLGLTGNSNTTHYHDSRYYTQTQLDSGQLDSRYYTETELDGGQLDYRYLTESGLSSSSGASLVGIEDVGGLLTSTDVEAALQEIAGKDPTITLDGDVSGSGSLTNLNDTTITVTVANDSHTHDARYYTETELDSGQLDNRYYTETELDGGQLDTRYYTETESDARFLLESNNLSDLTNVSTARTNLGLDAVASTGNHSSLTLDDGSNPHGTTKSDVGLSNVTNDAQLKIASNLSDLTDRQLARQNLEFGDSRVMFKYVEWGGDPANTTSGQWINPLTFTLDGGYNGFKFRALVGGRIGGGASEGMFQTLIGVARNGVDSFSECRGYIQNELDASSYAPFSDMKLVHRSGSGSTDNVVEVWLQMAGNYRNDMPVQFWYWGNSVADDITYLADGDISHQSSITTGYITLYNSDLNPAFYSKSIADDRFVNEIGDTMTGPLKIEGGNYSAIPAAGSDSTSVASLVIDRDTEIFFEYNGYLRTIIDTTNGLLTIGQSGTSLINGIDLKPGSSGNIGLYHNNSVVASAISTGFDAIGYTEGGSNTLSNNITGSAGTAGPAGHVIAFAGTSAPSGYLTCDGSAVSRSTYSALFSAIGTTWGAGDGSTTFNLPDLRGAFLRGAGSHGTEVKSNGAAFSGPAVGAFETDLLKDHVHPSEYFRNGSNSAPRPGSQNPYYGIADVVWNTEPVSSASVGGGSPRVGDETRPFAAGLLYCIKT